MRGQVPLLQVNFILLVAFIIIAVIGQMAPVLLMALLAIHVLPAIGLVTLIRLAMCCFTFIALSSNNI
jgi:predicted lysophospholipase L1 biosynthesis ABC-type transport system permease subunit